MLPKAAILSFSARNMLFSIFGYQVGLDLVANQIISFKLVNLSKMSSTGYKNKPRIAAIIHQKEIAEL